jgi:heterotetrameric sarcosine oxidase delta subunit
MLLITCPWCGPRGQTEFSYAGDATIRRPAAEASEQAWIDYVYLRRNPRGPHAELWQHSTGCRQFVTVHRDTLTHEISSTAPAREEK